MPDMNETKAQKPRAKKDKAKKGDRSRVERCSIMVSVRLPLALHGRLTRVRRDFNAAHQGALLTMSRATVMLLERGLATLEDSPI